MRKWRKLLAAALTVTLLAGVMAVPSFADEAQTKGWVYEDNVWHFYKSDGTMIKGREKLINGKYYAFKEDGEMYADILFAAPIHKADAPEGTMPNRYAFSDGHLAVEKWVKLNGEGKMYTKSDADGDAPIYWYYFGKGNEEEGTGGQMLANEEKTINKAVYRFHEDGIMYSQEWYGSENQEPAIGDEYYQKDGAKAVNKWLKLGGNWYRFGEKGEVEKILLEKDIETATDSNARAPYPDVASVEPVGKAEVTVSVGETAKLQFKVNLATDSNAVSNDFSRKGHDIWGNTTLLGKYSIKTVTKDGLCNIEYTPASVNDGEDVYLVVDGVKSEPIIVKAGVENLAEKDIDAKKDAVDAILESVMGDSGIQGDMATARDSIKTVIKTAGDDKKTLQDALVENKNYAELENLYAMQNNIKTNVEPSSEAAKQLGSKGRISMIGGALNAEGKDEEVVLKVDAAETPSDLVNAEGKKVVTFEISMAVNDKAIGQGEDGLDFPIQIVMTVPQELDPTRDIIVRHYHGDGEPASITVTPGKVTIDNEESYVIKFTADRFSSFAFIQDKTSTTPDQPVNPPAGGDSDDDDDSSSSSLSSKSSAAGGKWVLGAEGWWYKNSDNSYPANTWAYLEYNNVKDWYRFDQNGYIVTGWFIDADGSRYYMNPVSNGFMGAMQTGWKMIDGSWYYFNTVSDGYRGKLLVNTVTPDGYQVNENGQWID